MKNLDIKELPNAFYLRFADLSVDRTEALAPGLNADYHGEDEVVGLEIIKLGEGE